MTVADFTSLLKKPENVAEENIDSIKNIIDEFPFFQPAKAIYLKALKNQDSFRYNAALKNTAAYTTDRSILFDLITSKSFVQNKIAEKITKQISEIYDIEVDSEEVIPETHTENKEVIESINTEFNEAVEEKIIPEKKELLKTSFDFDNINSEAIMDPELFQLKPTIKNYSILSLKTLKSVETFEEEKEKIEVQKDKANEEKLEKVTEDITVKATEEKLEKTAEEKLEIGKPLEFDKTEKHSFSEWLKLSKIEPIKRDVIEFDKKEDITPKESTTFDKFKLIDKFIESRPKIIPSEERTSKNNLAKEREVEKEELMTETLARVYLEQKKYKKALQAYKILSLKYPEKSSFFANQINAVEKLQQNN